MNDNIVTRLRDWASTICTVRNDDVPGSKSRLIRNAADEIERLRAEIERLREERDDARAEISRN